MIAPMRRLAVLGLALLLQLAAPAYAATLTATTSAQAVTQAKAALPGDEVLLASGTYADPLISLIKKVAPGVVVKPQPGAVVTFAALTVKGSSGLTFDGLRFSGSVAISDSDSITVSRCVIDGAWTAKGPLIRNSTNVEVSDCEITHVGTGLVAYDNRIGGIRFLRNHIHDISGADAIDIFSSVSVTASFNYIHDIFPSDAAHSDAFQIDSPVTGGVRSQKIVVTDNRYERGGATRVVNGLTVSPPGSQGIVFAAHADDLTVMRNLTWGPLYNGMSLSDVHGAVVDNNFLQGYGLYSAKVTVRGGSSNIRISNTTANSIGAYVPTGDPPLVNVVFDTATNKIIPMASGPQDTALRDAWLARNTTTPAPPPATVEDQLAAAQAQISDLNARIIAMAADRDAAVARATSAETALAQTTADLTKAQADLAALRTTAAALQARVTLLESAIAKIKAATAGTDVPL